jgi:pyruvate formate lyase activating enzyme
MEIKTATMLKEALFYETRSDEGSVQCRLCPHSCRIEKDGTGICGVRKNIDGVLCAMTYDRISSLSLDPIEKKPLRRFHPGSRILSVGSVGCNMKCPFCQNHSISRCSMEEVEMIVMNSSKLVEQAISLKSQGNIGIAFTYNEPTVWYEYVYDTAKLAKEYGLYNVLVTNGYISKEPLERLLPFIDAMNIDLKSYDGTFYRETLHGGLEEVKAAILQSAAKCHVEVTTLVLPGVNDSREEITRIASFLSSISRKIPLHLSRFFPRFEWKDRSPTSIDTLYELALVAECYLDHVYVGNV